MDRLEYWDRIYRQKSDADLSWYQAGATLSLAIIKRLALSKDAAISDIGGGGPSALTGALMDEGSTRLSVLDVSPEASQRGGGRWVDRAERVTRGEVDGTGVAPTRAEHRWHALAGFALLP